MRKVLFVSNYGALDVQQLMGQFRESLGPQAPDFEVDALESLAEVPSWFARNASPSLVFIDWGTSARARVEARHLEQALAGIRGLDPHLSVLLLTESTPESQDTMHWLDRGATGLLARSFSPGQITDALAEILARKLSVQRPRNPRVDAAHRIVLRAASLEQGVVSETLNIGTGGFFARVVPEGVKTGDWVKFELHLTHSLVSDGTTETPAAVRKINDETGPGISRTPQVLGGSGFVAWIRRTPVGDAPEGMGIQFDQLDETAQRVLDRFVASHRVRAFIPRS